MAVKRVTGWVLASLCLFVVANTASYFLRSDGYGLRDVQDGIVRIGCPFLIIERGGFAHREFVSLSAALGNAVTSLITMGLVLRISCFMKQAAKRDA